MQKDLSEMSLEELWQLFPIQLSEPQPHWINWYEEEAHYLKKLLSFTICLSTCIAIDVLKKNHF